jgi:hypothetical protein
MASGIAVRGLRELSAAFAHAEKQVKAGFRDELRQVAEPVRRDAEALARASIHRVGVPWSRMRTGITRTSVYVAPRQRGTRRRDDPRARPAFGTLLMDRAMQPALDRNAPGIEHAFDRAVDRIADRWEH